MVPVSNNAYKDKSPNVPLPPESVGWGTYIKAVVFCIEHFDVIEGV